MTDDIYEHVVYDDYRFVTPAQVEPRLYERTLTINGCSKAYAMTGWRVGYGGGPRQLIDAINMIQSQSTTHTSSISQAAATAALDGPHDFLAPRNAAFKERRDMVMAMLGAGAMVVVAQATPEEFLAEIEWTTLAFFMALFVLVGGLVEVGVIGSLGRHAADAMGEHELLASTVLLFGSGVVGGFVDNIPYTAAMVPIVDEMVAASPNDGSGSPLWWAFVFGADLGGNTTAVAAGANVVVLGIAAKAGQPISFWQFTRYGLVVTFASLAVAWLYVWLRYFALA